MLYYLYYMESCSCVRYKCHGAQDNLIRVISLCALRYLFNLYLLRLHIAGFQVTMTSARLTADLLLGMQVPRI